MDKIPTKLLKEAADALHYPLSKIINESLKPSVFPDEHKITKPKSLFKKDSEADPKN